MKAELIYVELKTGYGDNGPAWIGNGYYNRTRKTVYFNGQVFGRSQGISGNHIDLENGEEYWISGVKRGGGDRHWAGSGTIQIDECVVEEYLTLRGLTTLPNGKFDIVTLDNTPAKDTSRDRENRTGVERFDDALRFKEPKNLSDMELDTLIDYYENSDLTSVHKKARKEWIDKLTDLKELRNSRQGQTASQRDV